VSWHVIFWDERIHNSLFLSLRYFYTMNQRSTLCSDNIIIFNWISNLPTFSIMEIAKLSCIAWVALNITEIQISICILLILSIVQLFSFWTINMSIIDYLTIFIFNFICWIKWVMWFSIQNFLCRYIIIVLIVNFFTRNSYFWLGPYDVIYVIAVSHFHLFFYFRSWTFDITNINTITYKSWWIWCYIFNML
jgi:hypothetical protein